MSSHPEKTLLVTERPLLSLTLRELLDTAGWETAHIVLNPEELSATLDPSAASLVMIDSEGSPSWEELKSLSRRSPRSRFVVWSPRVTPPSVQAAVESGVHGLLSLRLAIPDAAQALLRIWEGERQFRFDGDFQANPSAEQALSPREQQIVALVTEGRRNREIAEALHTTEGSVKVYLNRIFWKTGAKTRHELALAAHHVLRRRDVRARIHTVQSEAPPQFDAAWMFTTGRPDFRSTGEVPYDSPKR